MVADRIGMALHRLCVGEEAGARNLAFFRVKCLQPAMKGTSSVRRLRLRSFHVAAAGDERYLVCAAVAAAVVSCANCSSYVFCNECLFLCA